MSADQFDLAVIGAGVAGMAAALAAARQELKVVLFEQAMFGGLATNINHLAPAPDGLPGNGSELAGQMMSDAIDLGVDLRMEEVTAMAPLPSGALRLEAGEGAVEARSVLVASGARHRRLGLPGEEGFEHRGLSNCADCDGPLFMGQTAVVVGGGDSALQEAAVLAEFCGAVHLVHRGEAFSGRAAFVEAVGGSDRITVHFGTVVEAILGDEGVEGVTLRDLATGETRDLPCKGLFIFVGLEPNTGFLPAAVGRAEGAVQVDDNLETSLPNVFAAGAARAGHGGEIADAIRDAERAVAVIGARHAAA